MVTGSVSCLDDVSNGINLHCSLFRDNNNKLENVEYLNYPELSSTPDDKR